MKVGIISINSHTKVLNFASPLHSYAFQQFLTQNGIDSVIIDYKPCYFKEFDVRHPYDHYMKHPFKDEKKQEKTLNRWKELYHDREVRFDKFQKFIDDNYVQTPVCYNQDLLDVEDPGCDIYMCVTDVIWKYNPKNGFDRGFFLASKTFDGKGKIAYAASKGAKEYTDEQAVEFAKLVDSFDYIGCREKSLCDHVNNKTDKKAELVLDPVFLQETSFYEKLAVEPEEKGYVLVYAVMEDAAKLVNEAVKFANKKGLKLIDISDDKTVSYVSPFGERTTKYDIGVEDWLGYLKNAEYIFTNSFHCCCFSILFKKKFFVGPRSGDKVDWVLEIFGLTNRRIAYKKDFSKKDKDIDYDAVYKKLEKYRKQSAKFVLKSIHNVEYKLNNGKKKLFSNVKGIKVKK